MQVQYAQATLDWMQAHQKENGAWSDENAPALVTAYALLALEKCVPR